MKQHTKCYLQRDQNLYQNSVKYQKLEAEQEVQMNAEGRAIVILFVWLVDAFLRTSSLGRQYQLFSGREYILE